MAGLLVLATLALVTVSGPRRAEAQAVPQLLNIAVSKVAHDPVSNTDSAVLVVKTASVSSIVVEYAASAGGCPASYPDSAGSFGLARHEVPLSGLNPGAAVSALICYRVSDASTDGVIAQSSFRTTRRQGEPFSFGAVVDVMPWGPEITTPSSQWETIAGQMAGEGLDAVLLGGDIVHNYWNETYPARVEAKYNQFFSATNQMTDSIPLYAAVGNHEQVYLPICRTAYEREFTLPVNNGNAAAGYGEHYYSFDSGDTHFVSISSEIPGEEGLIIGDQLQWLEQDLAGSQKPWKVIIVHRPLFYPPEIAAQLAPYERWFNPEDPVGTQNRAHLRDLFQSTGVDVVFGGHAHWYHHHVEGDVHYVVTGGGGSYIAPGPDPVLGAGDLYFYKDFEHVKVDERAETLRVSMIDLDGGRRESFIMQAGGAYVDYIDSGDPPQITAIAPTGEIGTDSVTVSASFTDTGISSGIDPASARLELDGAVMSGCTATTSQISCAAAGLAFGEHTITASVLDNAGNSDSRSAIFFVAGCEPAQPDLALGFAGSYWSSYEEFVAGHLSVDYGLTNEGSQICRTVEIMGAINTNGALVASLMPVYVGDVEPAGVAQFTLKYWVPEGVTSFKSKVYATAGDDCGRFYEYPGPVTGP